MPNIASKQPEIVADGGFRIEIGADELAVSADRSAWKQRKRSIAALVLWSLLAAFVAYSLIPELADGGWALIFFLVLILGVGVIEWTFERTRNIRCTRETLEIIEVLHNRETGRTRYMPEQVQHIEFAPVSYGRYETVCGLVFKVDGNKVKVLRGIQSPEAQIALRELNRLGFDTVIDVGMPMAAEMVMERRNSWLGRLR